MSSDSSGREGSFGKVYKGRRKYVHSPEWRLSGLVPTKETKRLLDAASRLTVADPACFHSSAAVRNCFKNFLSSEDPDLRAKACSAIGNMCCHSSYFYASLPGNKVIQLVVERCSDPDKRTRKFACFAVRNAAYRNGMLYEELRRSIAQLTNLLLGPEEDKTKGNAAGALSNLARNSDVFCEDIVFQGAIQALLKIVSSFSTVALSPSRRDALTESPLRIVLFALRKMCDHVICRNFLRSSEHASAIVSRACQA